MVMSEQGGLAAMHQLPMHHRGLVQPSLVMNPMNALNDSCAMDSQNSKSQFKNLIHEKKYKKLYLLCHPNFKNFSRDFLKTKNKQNEKLTSFVKTTEKINNVVDVLHSIGVGVIKIEK